MFNLRNVHNIKIPLITDDRPRQEARFYTKNKITCVRDIPQCVSDCHLTTNKYFITHNVTQINFRKIFNLVEIIKYMTTVKNQKQNYSKLIMLSPLETRIPVHIHVSRHISQVNAISPLSQSELS